MALRGWLYKKIKEDEVECSKCGKKIGFLSIRNKLENGSILCNLCSYEWKKEKTEKNKKIMVDYISKYLSNKGQELDAYILECYKNNGIKYLFSKDSIKKVIEHFQRSLFLAELSRKSGMSSYQIDNIIKTKEMCEKTLVFLNDLGKMYRLFKKKDINTDYLEILSIFVQVIEENLDKEYDRILIPAFKRIRKKIGKHITPKNVIREFIRMPLSSDRHTYDTISRLLDKFNLHYTKKDVERVIMEVLEEIELENFEKDLGSSQKIEIGDFEKLNGYEFEGYLKGLFSMLGYTVVQTSLSGDQGADLIFSKNGEKTVVQAKKYNGKVSNRPIQEIVAAKNHYKAQKAIVVTNSSFTKGAIDLALSNNVELWDGLKLRNMIQILKGKNKEETFFQKSIILKGGKDIQIIEIPCPFCGKKFEYEVDIREGTNFVTECPHCGLTIESSKEKIWKCEYCNKQFYTKVEAEKHEKTCNKENK